MTIGTFFSQVHSVKYRVRYALGSQGSSTGSCYLGKVEQLTAEKKAQELYDHFHGFASVWIEDAETGEFLMG